jgi:ABC-type antimicrobial peptide transport system permease subunit
VRAVATRAIVQLGIGVVVGMPFAAAFFNSGGGSPYAGALGTLIVGVVVMVLVGLAACTGPTLRALRVHPSEALRADG